MCTRSKIHLHSALRIENRLSGVEGCSSHRGDVGTAGWIVRAVHGLVFAQTAALGTVSRNAPDPEVSACEEDGVSLQRQFHPLVALALIVADWDVGFGFAIANTDNSRGLVHTTLTRTLVAIRCWVWIDRIFPTISSDTVSCVVAVRAIQLSRNQSCWSRLHAVRQNLQRPRKY